MKKVVATMILLLAVAVLAACAQEANVPAVGSAAEEPGSMVQAPPSKTQPSGSGTAEPVEGGTAAILAPAPPVTEPAKNLPAASPKLASGTDADSKSVVLRMPSEVKFGETATATIVNNSSYTISFGVDYTFQYYTDNEWVDLQNKEGKERVWIEIACLLEPDSEGAVDFVIYQDEFTTALQPGEYRLIKNVYPWVEGMDSNVEIMGDFTVL